MIAMTQSVITQALLSLPLDARMTIARELRLSIDKDIPHPATPHTSDEEFERAHHQRILTRLKDVDDNPDAFVDGDTFLRELWERVGLPAK